MNAYAREEFQVGEYLTTQEIPLLEGSFEMEDRRTSSESSLERAEQKASAGSSLHMSEHDRSMSREGNMIIDERNTSSVALLEPALTRDLLATSVLHPPRSRSTEGADDSRPDSRNKSSSSSISCLLYDDRIANATTLDMLAEEYPLPKIQGPRWYNRLRYHYLSMYVRLHIIVLIINIAALIPIAIGSQRSKPTFTHQDASTAFAANMFVIFLTRNEHFINTLFHIFRECEALLLINHYD